MRGGADLLSTAKSSDWNFLLYSPLSSSSKSLLKNLLHDVQKSIRKIQKSRMRTDLAASTSVVSILQELLVQGAQQVLSRPLGFSLALSTVPFWAVAPVVEAR